MTDVIADSARAAELRGRLTDELVAEGTIVSKEVEAAFRRVPRGVRAILTHVLIFHWNRLGLPATSQGILARAATTALLTGNRPTPPRR